MLGCGNGSLVIPPGPVSRLRGFAGRGGSAERISKNRSRRLPQRGTPLETRLIGTITLWFDAGEEAAADLVGRACERGLDLLRDLWGLAAPDECRVYVMTSWSRVLFHPAPWPWRAYLAITLPLRYARIRKVWAMAGGWALRYGQRRVIGIKPPHLLRQVDADLREGVFVQREVDEAVEHNTSHELTHACSDHPRLPTWLHEGLAIVNVDHFAGRPTVKAETLGT